MKPAPLLLAIAGLALLGSAILAGGERFAERPAIEVESFEFDDQEIAIEAIPELEVALPGRPVAPEAFAPLATGPLQRIEARAPLSDLALAVPPKPGVPAPTLLHRPVATAAGRIEAGGHIVEIEGVRIVEADDRCRAAGGTWPCGMVARTAFRNWLRGRAVECTVSDIPSPQPVVSACRLGDEDVAAWLVENGFAEAAGDGPYAEAGRTAEQARRGIFGEGPGTGL